MPLLSIIPNYLLSNGMLKLKSAQDTSRVEANGNERKTTQPLFTGPWRCFTAVFLSFADQECFVCLTLGGNMRELWSAWLPVS